MQIEELIENFELLEDWEDRYRYIIDLGGTLSPLADDLKTDAWKVNGCQSQVWLIPTLKDGLFSFQGDSDAMIVKGIMAIILSIYSNKSAQEIKDIAVEDIFAKMGLKEHLSPSRRNGLTAMTDKIKFYANIL